jgi:5'-3' exonuclease
MIIIDYSQISIASFYAQPNAELSEDFLRHMILNSIRMYSHKFKKEYGDIVIACDGGKSWRKGYFPQYKAHRKKAREDSGLDWNLFFEYLNQIREEIKENFPYRVIHLEHIEADDVIATLVKETQEFGKNEPVMIISSDKDFIQLQKYKNVKQFSPVQKKMVTDPNPHLYLFEHVLRGDSGDGIPNVLSGDNTFVDGLRQTPITQKKIDAWLEKAEDIKSGMDDETYRNYQRNKTLIDLDMIPEDYVDSIKYAYDNQTPPPRARMLDYLIKKRCKMLVESISEF